jgi:sugar phosphate isomerase/epimerase
VIELSCGDQSWAALQHGKALELIRLLGFGRVDVVLGVNPRHLVAVDVAGDPGIAAAALAASLERLSLAVADVFIGPLGDFEHLCPNHPNSAERARSRELFAGVLEFARRLGSPGVTQVPGIRWPGETHAESLHRAAVELGKRTDMARRAGLRFSVEGHLGSVTERPEHLRELLALAPGLALTLDPSHFHAQGLTLPDYADLLVHARHVHFRGAAKSRPQIGLRESAISAAEIVGALREHAYAGGICLEYVCVDWERCDECDVVTETVQLRDELTAALARADTTRGAQ